MLRSRWYPVETIIDTDYADDQALLTYTPAQAEYLLQGLKKAAKSISLYVNSDKIEFICFNQDGTISTLNYKPSKACQAQLENQSSPIASHSWIHKYQPTFKNHLLCAKTRYRLEDQTRVMDDWDSQGNLCNQDARVIE